MSGSFSPGPASLAHGFCFLIAPVAEPPPIRRRFELCGCTSGLSAVWVTCALWAYLRTLVKHRRRWSVAALVKNGTG